MNTLFNLPTVQSTLPDDDMFGDLPPIDGWEVKSEVLAANLGALIFHCGKSRASLADELGLHKSAVTRLLNGKNNTKLKTVWDIATHLGYDFDVVFHAVGTPAPAQPWDEESGADNQVDSVDNFPNSLLPTQFIQFQLQTQDEVVRDHLNGIGRHRKYLSRMTPVPISSIGTFNFQIEVDQSVRAAQFDLIEEHALLSIES